MKILQAGVAKSGNYWLYKILKNIYSIYRIEEKSFIQNHPIHPIARSWELSYQDQCDIDVMDIGPTGCAYRISSVFRMPIDDIGAYVDQCSLVWTHSPFCEFSNQVMPKFEKVVYLIRDPRDMAVSLSKFMFTPYMQRYYPTRHTDFRQYLDSKLNWLTSLWVDHIGGYLLNNQKYDIHFIFYERLLAAFDRELANLLRYFHLDQNIEKINTIKEQVHFEKMKKESPGHVRQGKSGGWKQMLSPKQISDVHRLAGPMMDLLGYPTAAAEDMDQLPGLPATVSADRIKSIILLSKKKPLRQKLRAAIRIFRK